jgi:hypothetical protein
MFAADHALTGLIIKARYREVPLAIILVSVQWMELMWVALNYAGIERTVVDPAVHSVADIHLAYMPYSHSIATACGMAAVSWALLAWRRRPRMAGAVALGILSHLVLDLATHARDIALAPGSAWGSAWSFGSGLYERAPIVALILELGYGVLCVWLFTRRRQPGFGLYVFAIVANLANLSILSPALPGPEVFLGGHPLAVVTFVLIQIIVTLWLVWTLAARRMS